MRLGRDSRHPRPQDHDPRARGRSGPGVRLLPRRPSPPPAATTRAAPRRDRRRTTDTTAVDGTDTTAGAGTDTTAPPSTPAHRISPTQTAQRRLPAHRLHRAQAAGQSPSGLEAPPSRPTCRERTPKSSSTWSVRSAPPSASWSDSRGAAGRTSELCTTFSGAQRRVPGAGRTSRSAASHLGLRLHDVHPGLSVRQAADGNHRGSARRGRDSRRRRDLHTGIAAFAAILRGLFHFSWSGCRDLNPGPHRPERCALPGCATPRLSDRDATAATPWPVAYSIPPVCQQSSRAIDYTVQERDVATQQVGHTAISALAPCAAETRLARCPRAPPRTCPPADPDHRARSRTSPAPLALSRNRNSMRTAGAPALRAARQ